MPLDEVSSWFDRYDCKNKMVLASAQLLLMMAEDANPDTLFTVEWGEPITREITFYEPRITRYAKPEAQ